VAVALQKKALPREFRRYCFLVIIVSIVGQDPFHLFDPVVKNKLPFRVLNFNRKLLDCLEKFINIIAYTICKRCLDMAEKPEVR
jgi:hypothetical protein